MPKIFRKRKSILVLFCLPVLILGIFIFRDFSAKAQEGINISSSTVDGDWQNKEAVLRQDLGPKASFEEFNNENSTYPFMQNSVFNETKKLGFFNKIYKKIGELFKQNLAEAEEGVLSLIDSVSPPQDGVILPTPVSTEAPTPTPTETPTPTIPILIEKPIQTETPTPSPTPIETPTPIEERPTPTEMPTPEITPIVKTLELSNFNIPEDVLEKEIQKVQLKFSLAGRGGVKDDKLLFGYQNGASGEIILGEIDFSQTLPEATNYYTFSNAINGGYFSYDLPFDNWEDLKSLNIKFKFIGNYSREAQTLIYLDAVWLDIKFAGLKNEVDTKFNVQSLGKKDFRQDETPEFELIESPNFYGLASADSVTVSNDGIDKKYFLGAIASISGNKEISAILVNPSGDEMAEGITIQKNSIKISRSGKSGFVPGLYKLKVETEQGGEAIIQEKEFRWGVLAINTNKSIYLPQENAYLQMAVLRDDGHTICDANLKLEITAPSGGIAYPEVQKSDKCGPDNITDVPDYFSYYQVEGAGIYQMKLKNLDANYEISDFFEVRDSIPFDVERIGPTRIYPPVSYQMTLRIKVNQDFTGEIIEYVPSSFVINDQSPNSNSQTISNDPNTKQIIWDVNWKAGESYELKYQFDAPDISPYIYLLGPLSIGRFQEARQWQIASDSPDTRTKTVEYFVGQYYGTGIASTTVTNYDFTVYLPDAISSATVVRSAFIEYNSLIDGTADISATDFQLGVVGSLTSLSAPDAIDQTGESTPVGMKLDATAKLQSIIQAAGTFNLRFSTAMTGTLHYGESARLKITYDYDDTAATQLKTVYAWVHSQAATLASTVAATSAIFNLGLPESSITSRSTFIETRGYVNAALQTGFYWNSEVQRNITWNNTTVSYGFVALVSPTTTYSPNTNNTFTIKSVSGAFSAPSAILVYTYSFNYSASTELMNSLKILLWQQVEAGGTATLTGNRVINIPEAGITMKSSFLQGRAVNTNVATMTSGINAQLGSTPSTTGIDFLANAGETSGFRTIVWDVTSNLSTMAAGNNTVYWAYATSAVTNIRGLTLYLNYKYNKASTTNFNFQMEWFVGQQTAASTTWSQVFTPSIADSNYTLKQSFLNHQINENATTALAATIGISTTDTYVFLTTGENTMGEVWRDTSSDVSALGSGLTATLDNSRSSTKSASFLVWWQAWVPIISLTVSPSSIAYGTVVLNSTKSTTEVSSTITITNTGNVTENITGISSDAVGGSAWELAATQGATGFTHKFDEGGTPYSWTTFNIDNSSYVDIKLGLTASSTTAMDLQVGIPTSSDTTQKTITVTVQATQQ